jgi:hypothetical protein
MDHRWRVGTHHVKPLRCIVQRDAGGMRERDRIRPFERDVLVIRGDLRRIDDDIQLVTFKNAIWRAARFVAPAFIEQNRNFLGLAFLISDTDLQRVRGSIRWL